MVKVTVKNHKYEIIPSWLNDKKYAAYPIIDKNFGNVIHFGSRKHQQYKDKIGYYRDLDHLDPKRRKKYIARHSAIKKKNGTLAINDPFSPAFLSFHLLW